MSPRRALGTLILVTMALRLAWAASLGAGHDEAYHYLFALHPAWSYYDHPPMLAVVERFGLGLFGAAGSPAPVFALRFGFVLLFAGSTWLMARLGSRLYGPWAGVYAAIILNLSAYHTAAAGAFALPDGPLLFFWLLTLDRLVVAVRSEGIRPWLAVGVAWGLALLSKYHAVFLPVGAFAYALTVPRARHLLRNAGPYLAMLVGLMIFAPVIAWNARNGWSSFAFQGARAVGELRFRPDTFMGAIGGQVAYLTPWMWAFLIGSAYVHLRSWIRGEGTDVDRFLLCQSLVPLGAFLAISCTRAVLPHWALVGYLGLMPLLGQSWATAAERAPGRARRRVATLAGVCVAAAAIFAAWERGGLLQREGPGVIPIVPVASDPTVDLYGWPQVAAELRRRGLVDRPGTFVFTSRWYYSGQLAFALGGKTPVLCYNPTDCHAFRQWSRPTDWVGRDGILVSINRSSAEPGFYERWFERIEPLGTFEIERSGAPVRKVRLYRCVNQVRPFPFDGVIRPGDRSRLALGDDAEGVLRR